MNQENLNKIVERSKEIRKRYHQLENEHHGSEWTIEEDALAFLTDAGLSWKINNVSTKSLAKK